MNAQQAQQLKAIQTTLNASDDFCYLASQIAFTLEYEREYFEVDFRIDRKVDESGFINWLNANCEMRHNKNNKYIREYYFKDVANTRTFDAPTAVGIIINNILHIVPTSYESSSFTTGHIGLFGKGENMSYQGADIPATVTQVTGNELSNYKKLWEAAGFEYKAGKWVREVVNPAVPIIPPQGEINRAAWAEAYRLNGGSRKGSKKFLSQAHKTIHAQIKAGTFTPVN